MCLPVRLAAPRFLYFTIAYSCVRSSKRRVVPCTTDLRQRALVSGRDIRAGGLNGLGWCFSVDAHQQQALERVAATLGAKAAVVYAAPAFHSLLQFYRHTGRSSIVEHSTFPDVLYLRGHSTWFYDSPGGAGIANAETEPFDGPS